ncbi:MAG: hypothetical protein WD066_03540 [Planctomycetaceae bacterium]
MSKSTLRTVSITCIAAMALLVPQAIASADAAEVVAYRLTNWKTLHFDDAAKAQTHADAVKRLGCEVKTDNHGGHVDVAYRCSEWKQIELSSHSAADAWERWLKASGFETRHQH